MTINVRTEMTNIGHLSQSMDAKLTNGTDYQAYSFTIMGVDDIREVVEKLTAALYAYDLMAETPNKPKPMPPMPIRPDRG